MTDAALLDELTDILGAEPGTLTPDTTLDTPGITWDSMALLAYLAFLRFHYNTTLANATCADFRTVADLIAKIPTT